MDVDMFEYLFRNTIDKANEIYEGKMNFKEYYGYSKKSLTILNSSEFFGIGSSDITEKCLIKLIANHFFQKDIYSIGSIKFMKSDVGKKYVKRNRKGTNLNGQNLKKAYKSYENQEREIRLPQADFIVYFRFIFEEVKSNSIVEIIDICKEKYHSFRKALDLGKGTNNVNEIFFIASYTNNGSDLRHFIIKIQLSSNGKIQAKILKPKSENLIYIGDFISSRGHRVGYFRTDLENISSSSDFIFIMIPKANINSAQEFLHGTISYIDIDSNGKCAQIILIKSSFDEISKIKENQELYFCKTITKNRDLIDYFVYNKIDTKYQNVIPEKLNEVRSSLE